MKKLQFLVVLALLLAMSATVFAAAGADQGGAAGAQPVTAYSLPRNQTLYFNGIQWSAPRGNSPYANNNNGFAENGHRQLQFETLFVYNLLDGKLYPQIGDSYSWSGQTLTVQINPNVKFSNGTPLTSADVVYCFDLAKKYSIGPSGYWTYLDSVTAQGNYTVVFKGKAPPNFNMKQMEQAISEVSITSKAYWESKIASGDLGSNPSDLINFMGWDCVGTGPYKLFYYDETKLVAIRNDDYWGKHPSRYGKLPAPKYIAHNGYKDNATGDEAFRRGEVDMSQQFIAQVWRMWEQGAAVETYISQPPYYMPGVIPSIIFNTTKPGLDDKAVRKAIAMVLDYDMIGTNAMSGYTAKKQASMMLPLPSEQALIDLNALKPQQWEGIDVTGANRILDQAGWTRGADGIRAKGGTKLSFKVECPQGWSDWNASLEVVAQAGRGIGMDLTTYFPDAGVWTDDRLNGTFDIIMDSPGGQGISSPWSRAYSMMYSKYLPPRGTPNAIGNWGRYSNARADQIIDAIPNETDAAKLKALWTELNQIYLDEMPCAGLMYRPWVFHTVNSSVWTGFPKLNDGSNVPPTILINGYGIKALYNLKLK
ncbi:MAG: ABC transporter substrate-binding protein [Treponema sp.]|jgi:peptide/nickel transport system substrate-binding protein|nr:ABC transporter substrate-binding protein [Treponema sp.]